MVGELDFATPPGFTVIRSSLNGVDMELRKPKVPWYMLSVISRDLGNVASLSAPELHKVIAELRNHLQKPGPLKYRPILVQGHTGYLLDYSGVSGKTRLHARQIVWVREGLLTIVSCLCAEKEQKRSQHFLLSLIKDSHWSNEKT